MSTRVLLLWPGSEAEVGGNFGVPQLVGMATWAAERTTASIHIRDLDLEKHLGVGLRGVLGGPDGRGYDIVAIAVYSSFDWLKGLAIAALAREWFPRALLVAGGYHASARPDEVVAEGSPFDVCVVGEGEVPLVRLIESVDGGEPLRGILGPLGLPSLSELPLSDWSFLSRYRQIAHEVASQAQIYLSRGCPFDCAFCMERAKRDVSWRPLPVDRAIAELENLHRWLNVDGWTIYVSDALFGMKRAWRREFLDRLAALGLPTSKLWALIRVDLVEEEDLRLFAAANLSPGFGLESGDPDQLARIRKTGRLDDYLDRMKFIAARARELQVPWGANIICGHPGETAASMRTSAAYMRDLFLDPRGTTGFLSVDPFRLYPGSPIDAERGRYEAEHGTVFHRPEWWHDGDPEFLSEWVDPSADLDWKTREALQAELLTPVLSGIEDNFVYRGSARDYYLRAVRSQVAHTSARSRLHYLDRYYAWQRYLGHRRRAEAGRLDHPALGEVCREVREQALPGVAYAAEVSDDHPVIDALRAVPRERFVPVDSIRDSVRDVAIELAPGATVSAMHAYARAHALLDLRPGDRVVDLGAGSGYGTALLRHQVGPPGQVWAIEADTGLVAALRHHEPTARCGDGRDPGTWDLDLGDVDKIVAGFALPALPPGRGLRPGVVLVAPVEVTEGQHLVRAVWDGEDWQTEVLDEVLYVSARPVTEHPTTGAPPA